MSLLLKMKGESKSGKRPSITQYTSSLQPRVQHAVSSKHHCFNCTAKCLLPNGYGV